MKTGPSHGSLSGTAPDLTYTPEPGFYGSDSFTYVVNDEVVDSAPATVDITVLEVNHPPVADPKSISTHTATPVAVTLTGSDANDDPIIFNVHSQPAHGALTGTVPNLTYTPEAGYVGPDSFTYIAVETAHAGDLPTLQSEPATVAIDVVNKAPAAQGGSVTTDEGEAVDIVLKATDPDGDALGFVIVTPPAHGSLGTTAKAAHNASTAAAAVVITPDVTYTPADGFSGTDTFTFAATDGMLQSPDATETIVVNAAAEPTTATTEPEVLAAEEEQRDAETLPFTGSMAVQGLALAALFGVTGWWALLVARDSSHDSPHDSPRA